MQRVHDFVTLFSSKEAVVTQELAAKTSKVDTEDDMGYVAITQERAADPTGNTQEPPIVNKNDQIDAEQ